VGRTLIVNARLLTLDPGAAWLEPASLVLEDGAVAALLADASPRDAHAETLDAGGALVLPGLVNAHTHCYSSLVRGIEARLDAPDFVALLRNLWWRLDASLEPEDVELSAALAALDGLRRGVTTVFDHHASYGCIEGSLARVAAGLAAVGQRGVLCFEISDRLGAATAAAALRENARHARDGVRPPWSPGAMLGLHASFTLSDATLGAAAALVRATGLAVHVHVAEDGTGVVARLERFGLLGPGALVAHAVHLDALELRRLAELGAVVAHNPRSNMNNGVGRADVGAMQLTGCQVALGTDAYGPGLLAEARVATLLQRHAPRLGPGHSIAACLLDGNPNLAAAYVPHLGRLHPGAPADVVVTRYVPPTPMHAGNAWPHLLFGDVEESVRAVFVAGERVLDEGRSTRVDETELKARCRDRAAALWERFRRAAPRWQAPGGAP